MKKIRELKAYFDERSGLREINLMIEGLREYQKSGEDSPELSEGIAALEKASGTRAAALEAKAKEVRAAIDSVEDILCRTLATLHYCDGLSWDEAGALCGLSMYGAKQKVRRFCGVTLTVIGSLERGYAISA